MRVAVIGMGYVGLVTGTCLAEMGNDVIGVDADAGRIVGLKRGELPIYEPGLEELVERNVEEGRLTFTTDIGDAVAGSLLVFIAVGTPSSEDGGVDMSYVHAAAREIGRYVTDYKIIVQKSTAPVGTHREIRELVAENARADFDVVANPEFLKEGSAVRDFMMPDRIIIGTESRHAAEVLTDLYMPYVRTANPIMVMDPSSAEMTKYASNAMLACRISFINEIATLCERLGADVGEVRRGMGADSRIGYTFLFPGVGYGGSCFPKDVRGLVKTAESAGFKPRLLAAIDQVNVAQRRRMIHKILSYFDDALAGKTVAVWGLAFKPRTDDIREAPALDIIEILLARGAAVRVYDPEAMKNAKAIFGDAVHYGLSEYDALDGADALVIVTEWNEFRNPDFERMKKLMKSRVIFDGRNIYRLETMRREGFTYFGVGTSTGASPGGL